VRIDRLAGRNDLSMINIDDKIKSWKNMPRSPLINYFIKSG